MVRPLRLRLETAAAVVAAVLAIITFVWPRWPEERLGIRAEWPGWPAWTFAAALMVLAIALLLVAWLEGRATTSRASRTGSSNGGAVQASETTPAQPGQASGEVFTSRRKAYDPARWTHAYSQKRQMPAFVPFALHLDRDHETLIRAAKAPLFLPHVSGTGREKHEPHTPQVRIAEVANPAPGASLGYAGPVVRVDTAEPFFLGVLVFPREREATPQVAPDTVRVFRWHDGRSHFEPVEPSGAADGYVWARISSPGVYTLIGLPADPFKQVLIRVTSAVAPSLAGMAPEDRAAFLSSIGRTLGNRQWFGSFGAPTMQAMFLDGWLPPPNLGLDLGFDGFPEGPDDLPGGGLPGGGLPGGGSLPGGGGSPGDPYGWDPGDDICPRMPYPGWPERWLLPLVEWPGVIRLLEGWIHQGPVNLPGHSTEVQVDPGDHRRVYTATANGGLWVLDDVTRYPSGSSWRPLTDLNENLNLQCFAIAPSNNLVLYYADGASRVFRSPDRGASWARTRDATFNLANRILVDPVNADTLYLATEGGFYRSTNAGHDWDTLYTGAVADAVMDHQNAAIIYLGVRNVGVVKTTTGGTGTSSWSTVFAWSNASTPTGTEIRLALGRQRTAATRTVVARFDQEVFVNQNGGIATTGPTGWSSKGKVGGDGYSWWCFALGVSPHDDRIILAGSQDLYRTATGAAPWSKVGGYDTTVHADFWDVTFDPAQVGVVYCANDGGVYRSTDSGATWQYLDNRLVTAQLYATGINGNRAVSGMYHQGIVASTSLSTKQWQGIEGGSWEFSRIYGDPKRPYTFYVFATKLHRRRWPEAASGTNFNIDWGNFTVTSIGVDPRPTSGIILCGARDPSTVKRTTAADFAAPTWTNETIALNTGEIVTSIAFAPSQPGMAYLITNGGRVFRKDDVSTSSAWALVSTWTGHAAISLAVDPHNHQRLYAITTNTIGRLDLTGGGWATITGSAPAALPTDSPYVELLTHPTTSGALFVAQDIGVFISVDDGANWQNYDNNTGLGAALPNAPIQDINWSGGNLYAVCHGRGLWRRTPLL
jgi:hypothetical protein